VAYCALRLLRCGRVSVASGQGCLQWCLVDHEREALLASCVYPTHSA
jgi:hypothetical protein